MEKKIFIFLIITFLCGLWLGFSFGAYSTAKFGIYVAEQVLEIKFKPEFVTFLTTERYKLDRYASVQNLTTEGLLRQGSGCIELS